MTLLPIVGRELRVAARRRGTYSMRVLAALVAIVMFGWMMLAVLQGIPSAMHGRYLFRTLFGFAFVYCLLVGARLTSDCLSEEKREGTLGLLFLTDLKGYDVVFGKLAATSVNSIYAVLALLPVIALPVQLGGVAAADLWQSALVLLNTLFFSLASGVFVSTLSRNERKAMTGTLFVLLLFTFGPFVLTFTMAMNFPRLFNSPEDAWPFLALSPVYSFGHVAFSSAFFRVPGFWWSLLLVHLSGWFMLLTSSRILPRIWQGRVANSRLDRGRERVEQWAYGRSESRRAHRHRLLDINPFLWLVSRERWKPLYVWFYVAAVSATWLWGEYKYGDIMFDRKTLVPSLLLFQTFVKLWVVSEACTRLSEDRRIGALELLLSTPLTTREILRGQWLAFRRQFGKPLVVILLFEYVLLRRQYSASVTVANLVMLVADLLTLGWVGMWMGLNARSLNRAILGAIARVLILPWVIFGAVAQALELYARLIGRPFTPLADFPVYLWFGIGVLTDSFFGFYWARRHLLRDFRAAATERFQTRKIGWFNWSVRRKDVALVRAPATARET